MREVVERITCDIGGEVTFEGNGELVISKVPFSFNDTSLELDVCGKCRPKMMRMSMQSLVDLGRVVQQHKAQKKTTPKKRNRAKEAVTSEKRWAEQYDEQLDQYNCPHEECDRFFDTARKLGAHYGQVHTRKQQTLAKAV